VTSWATVLKKWQSFKDQFDHSFVYEYPGVDAVNQSSAIWSQIVWDATYMVGCGYSRFKTNDGVTEVFVCNYGPG
jgi:hypothetical protein